MYGASSAVFGFSNEVELIVITFLTIPNLEPCTIIRIVILHIETLLWMVGPPNLGAQSVAIYGPVLVVVIVQTRPQLHYIAILIVMFLDVEALVWVVFPS